jgi:hypothetical protein
MKIGDLVKIRLDDKDGDEAVAVILTIKQKVDGNGFVEDPNYYAFDVFCQGPLGRIPVFDDEVMEVISESR